MNRNVKLFLTILRERVLRRTYVKISMLREFGDAFQEVHVDYINVRKPLFEWGKGKYVLQLSKAIFTRKRPLLFYVQGKPLPIDLSNRTPVLRGKGRKTTGTEDAQILKDLIESEKIGGFLGSRREKMFLAIITVLGVCVAGVAIWAIYNFATIQQQLMGLLESLGLPGGYVPG